MPSSQNATCLTEVIKSILEFTSTLHPVNCLLRPIFFMGVLLKQLLSPKWLSG